MSRNLLFVVFMLLMIVVIQVNGNVEIKNHRGRMGTSGKYQQVSRGRRSQDLNISGTIQQLGEDFKNKISIKTAEGN